MITPAEQDFYRSEGYVVPQAVLADEAELAGLRALCDRLIADRVGAGEGLQFDLTGVAGADSRDPPAVPQLLFPSRFAPQIRETACWRAALDLAMALLDTGGCRREDLVVRDHIIVKPPGSASPTPWHQDEAYWKPEVAYNELSVWIALQDVTAEMGCMQFLPRSHRGAVAPHHPWKGDARIIALEIDPAFLRAEGAVACPIAAGRATVHHSRTLHFTSGNRSATARRALILTVGTPPQPRPVR